MSRSISAVRRPPYADSSTRTDSRISPIFIANVSEHSVDCRSPPFTTAVMVVKLNNIGSSSNRHLICTGSYRNYFEKLFFRSLQLVYVITWRRVASGRAHGDWWVNFLLFLEQSQAVIRLSELHGEAQKRNSTQLNSTQQACTDAGVNTSMSASI